MAKVYAGDLAGKEVVTIEGMVMGEVDNMIFDVNTGILVDLVIKPDAELNRQKYREEGKFILVPFSSICAVRNYIVVDDSRALKK